MILFIRVCQSALVLALLAPVPVPAPPNVSTDHDTVCSLAEP